MDWLKKAIILGFAFFLAIFLVKPIGVSTQFSVLSGIIHKTFDRGIIWEDDENEYGYASSNEYYNRSEGKLANAIENPINYDFIFVLAIPLGGLLGSLLWSKGHINKKTESDHSSIWKAYGPSFLSGFLLLYGARLADGCTSGHMMSGIMQGSVSGYVFAASAFAVAIPTAFLVSIIRKENG